MASNGLGGRIRCDPVPHLWSQGTKFISALSFPEAPLMVFLNSVPGRTTTTRRRPLAIHRPAWDAGKNRIEFVLSSTSFTISCNNMRFSLHNLSAICRHREWSIRNKGSCTRGLLCEIRGICTENPKECDVFTI